MTTGRRTAEEIAEHEFDMARFQAQAATCPRCGALGRVDIPLMPDGTKPGGQPCRNPLTGRELRGPAHFQRFDAVASLPEDETQ
ncbi:hypothetical protein [Actinophytocola sediminis]